MSEQEQWNRVSWRQMTEVVNSLQHIDIEGLQLPTYRNIPLTQFTKDDLIRMVKYHIEVIKGLDR